jgi:hypothetical protein
MRSGVISETDRLGPLFSYIKRYEMVNSSRFLFASDNNSVNFWMLTFLQRKAATYGRTARKILIKSTYRRKPGPLMRFQRNYADRHIRRLLISVKRIEIPFVIRLSCCPATSTGCHIECLILRPNDASIHRIGITQPLRAGRRCSPFPAIQPSRMHCFAV